MRTRRRRTRRIGPVAVLLLCGGVPWHGAALAQAAPAPVLPNLVLPPEAAAQPESFNNLMRMGDSAMLRGDVARARSLYERAAAMQPASAAASLAAGKTYDPNVLSLLGASDANLVDAAKARIWYERARVLGHPGAPLLLAPLR